MGTVFDQRECQNDKHLDKVMLCEYECDGLVCSKCCTEFAGKKICLECKLILDLKYGTDGTGLYSVYKTTAKDGSKR